MNFKTPFKVLTTAALIGTLSLSAVAPSASAATNTEKTSVSQKAATTIENVVFKTADGQYLTLTPSEYLDAKEAGVDFSKLELVAVQADNKSYSKEDYLDAKEASQNDPAKAFELLAKTEGAALEITTAPAVIEKDENGNFVVKPGTPAVDEDFKVTEIAAITTTGVDVKFQALTADVKDVTVEVKNSKGEAVEVKAVDLKKGDTTASFDFSKAVAESDLTGKWTVDGQTYDFGEKATVENIVKKASESSDVVALETLKDAGIENVEDDLIAGYKNAINEADPAPTTLAEIQKLVDDANAEFSKVKAVVDAAQAATGKEVKVFNALKAGFENVESRWSEDYQDAFVKLADGSYKKISALGTANYTGVTAVSFEELQKALNRVAVAETFDLVEDLYTEKPKAEDVATVKSLATKYAKLAYQVEDEVTAGDYLTDRLAKLELLLNVDKATTKAAVKSALVKLGEFDAKLAEKYDGVSDVKVQNAYAVNTPEVSETVNTGFEVAEYTLKSNVDAGFAILDANLEAYVKDFATLNWGDKDSTADIVAQIITTNDNQAGDLVEDLKEAASDYSAETRPAYLKALQAVGAQRVATANNDEYVTTDVVSLFAAFTGSETVKDDVQPIVDAANINVVKELAAAGKATDLVNALKVLEIKDLTIDSANRALYVEKIEAAVLSAFSTGNVAANTTKITNAVKAANTEAEVAAALKAVNAATTAAEAKTALDSLSKVESLTAYSAIPAADKEYVAGLLLDARNLLTSDRVVVDENAAATAINTAVKAKEFRTVAELKGYLTKTVNGSTANIDFNGTEADKGTLTSPLAQRTALISGVNEVKSNQFDSSVLTADVTDASVDNTVTYASSTPAVATVDTTGTVTAVAAGTASITATVNGVVVKTTSVTATGAGTFDGGTVPTVTVDNTVTYASSTPAVATVDTTGTVTAVAAGTTEITAKVNNVVVKTTDVNVTAQSYEEILKDTATKFKALGVPGFSPANKPVSSDDIELVENYFNSSAFYTEEEAAKLTGKDKGELKADYKTVAEILAFFK